MEHDAAGAARSGHPTIFDPALPAAAEPEPARRTTPGPARRSRGSRVASATRDVSDEVLAARQRRQARHALELSSLLSQRTELRGVYAPADLVAEALSWSA